MSSRPAAMAARVLRTAPVAPHTTRITLGGPELARFVGVGHDQVVRMFFPQPGQLEPVIPDGADWWESFRAIPEDRRPALRNFTVRRFDPAALELDVDFVLHGDAGPASAWAVRAAPGDVVGVCHDAASAKWPDGTDWLLLVADETGLPALSVILEELPAGQRALAYVEVDGPGDEVELAGGPGVDVVWLHRGGVPAGRSDVVVRALRAAELPAGRVFAWVAGESGMVKEVRRHLVRDRGVDKRRVGFGGYWLHEVHEVHDEKLHRRPALSARTAAQDRRGAAHPAPVGKAEHDGPMTDRGDEDGGDQPPGTLVRFVLARLAEVERTARTAHDLHLGRPPADPAAPLVVPIARHAPERVLRDVAADRAVVRAWVLAVRSQLVAPVDPDAVEAAEAAIARMATGFAGHPDYRAGWLPAARPTADEPGDTPGDRSLRPVGTVTALGSGRVRRRRRQHP